MDNSVGFKAEEGKIVKVGASVQPIAFGVSFNHNL